MPCAYEKPMQIWGTRQTWTKALIVLHDLKPRLYFYTANYSEILGTNPHPFIAFSYLTSSKPTNQSLNICHT